MYTTSDINQMSRRPSAEADFPDAPADWTRHDGEMAAQAEDLRLTDVHWDVVRALQSYFVRHDGGSAINMRELHDALDERFHAIGGLRQLYKLFPGGPLAQGCAIAGLKAPSLSQDSGFGSVA